MQTFKFKIKDWKDGSVKIIGFKGENKFQAKNYADWLYPSRNGFTYEYINNETN